MCFNCNNNIEAVFIGQTTDSHRIRDKKAVESGDIAFYCKKTGDVK